MLLAASLLLAQIQYQPEPGGEWSLFQHHFGSQPMKFGASIASLDDVDFDGVPDYCVGADASSLSGNQNGSVFVFSGSTGQELRRHDGEYFWHLGYPVSNLGDVDADGIRDYGAIGLARGMRIYSGAVGSVLYEYLPPPGSGYGIDTYPSFLCGIGDHDQDGYADFAVSDPAYDAGGMDGAGAIYFYSGQDGSLIQRLDGWLPYLRFGAFLTNLGDTDGDGYEDFGFQSAYRAGYSAHVYSGHTLTELYRIDNPSGGSMGVSFGRVGDVDNDGCSDFVVGAPWTYWYGRAYLCSGRDGRFLRIWSSGEFDDWFGMTSDGAGDVNGDGVPDIVIGALDAGSILDGIKGAAYVYSGATGGLLFKQVGSYALHSLLGFSVAGLGDLDGDGRNEVAFGANAETVNGVQNAGSVYIYSFDPYLTPSTIVASAAAGGAVTYTLDFPPSEAGLSYRLLASTSRSDRPWIRAYGVSVPLVETWVLHRAWHDAPTALQGGDGILDANGDASAVLTLPPGAATAWIGRTLRLAAVSFANATHPSLSSAAVTLTIEL